MRHGTVLDLISKRSLYALYTACMVVPSNFFCEMQTNDFIAGAMMEKVNGIKKDYYTNLKTEKEFYEVRNRKPKSYPIGVVGSGLPQPGTASPGGATTDCSVTPSKEGARKLGGSSTATPQPARYDDIGTGVYKVDSKNSTKKGIGKLFSTKPRKKKPMSFCPKCKQYERIPMRRVNVGPGKIAERIECCNCGYVEMMPILRCFGDFG